MPRIDIHPTTLESIKRLAKSLKRDDLITHCEALDLAARKAGFSNFTHAKRSLAASPQRQSAALNSAPAWLTQAAGNGLHLSSSNLTTGSPPLAMGDFLRGRSICRDGKPVPGFSGSEDEVIAGWFVERAGVEADARLGFAERVYDSLIEVANQYTSDRGFAETLTSVAMNCLSKTCDPVASSVLRDYSDERYFAFGDTIGY